ncbi:MAG: hypothetical protein IE914_05200 [Thiotrichales bacterium]|nr:hypothetical protein [Thiotrichales bacterium]
MWSHGSDSTRTTHNSHAEVDMYQNKQDNKTEFQEDLLVLKAAEMIRGKDYLCLATWHNLSNRRYYRLSLGKDLLGDMVVEREWGSLDTHQHNSKRAIFLASELSNVLTLVRNVFRTREAHGYALVLQASVKPASMKQEVSGRFGQE